MPSYVQIFTTEKEKATQPTGERTQNFPPPLESKRASQLWDSATCFLLVLLNGGHTLTGPHHCQSGEQPEIRGREWHLLLEPSTHSREQAPRLV